jgi:putative ABC transport system permease protein
MGNWPLALRLARREMRGGIGGFRIFLACLALGVGAIAAIGSLKVAVEEGLATDARKILGGDVDIRIIHRDAPPKAQAWLRANAKSVSRVVEMRSMAYRVRKGAGRDRLLVELKGVDQQYPLYGNFEIGKQAGGSALIAPFLAPKNGLPGALVEDMVLTRMRLKIGDVIRIGAQQFRVSGVIAREPDRGTGLVTLGPRLMVGLSDLQKTGLIQPGSLLYFHYRVKLAPGANVDAFIERLKAAFPKAGWRVRALAQAAPGLRRFLDQMAFFLTLVGLTALLVGGLGIANGVRAYLEGRVATIATFKCVGAPAGLVFRTYLVQMLMIAIIGVIGGLAIGVLLPWALSDLLNQLLPVKLQIGIYPEPLALASLFGLLTALAFSMWSLGKARMVPPGALFRQGVSTDGTAPPRAYVFATVGLVAILVALIIATSVDKVLAAIFIAACGATFFLFRGFAWVVARLAKRLSRPGGAAQKNPGLRLALANLHRPGAPTPSVILSLGLGATVLVAISLIEGNFTQQVRERLPKNAPSYFFVDIQPDQVKAFEAAVRKVAGPGALQRQPMVRGRIVRLNGKPVDLNKIHPDARWAVRNERGLTYAAKLPKGARILKGKWWPASYSGPPLVSFDARLAAGMGLVVGSTMTINILGREITARVANLREIRWQTMRVNFTIIFAPGTLESAPHSHISSVQVPREKEVELLRAVTDKLPNISAIRVRDALESAAQVLDKIGFAVRATAGVTILAGLFVLAGAVAAGHRRRVYDAVVLKVLGATRGRVLRAFLLEYGLLGVAVASISAILGTIVAWLVMTLAMRVPWTFMPVTVIGTALVCAAVAIAFGFVGTWRAMGQKPAPLLRNE